MVLPDGNANVLNRDPLANRDYEHKSKRTQRKSRCGFGMGMSLGPKAMVCDPFMGAGTDGRCGAEPG